MLPPLSGVPVGLGEGVEVASSPATDNVEELTMSGEGEGLVVTEEEGGLAVTEEVDGMAMTEEVEGSGSGWASASVQ